MWLLTCPLPPARPFFRQPAPTPSRRSRHQWLHPSWWHHLHESWMAHATIVIPSWSISFQKIYCTDVIDDNHWHVMHKLVKSKGFYGKFDAVWMTNQILSHCYILLRNQASKKIPWKIGKGGPLPFPHPKQKTKKHTTQKPTNCCESTHFAPPVQCSPLVVGKCNKSGR